MANVNYLLVITYILFQYLLNLRCSIYLLIYWRNPYMGSFKRFFQNDSHLFRFLK